MFSFVYGGEEALDVKESKVLFLLNQFPKIRGYIFRLPKLCFRDQEVYKSIKRLKKHNMLNNSIFCGVEHLLYPFFKRLYNHYVRLSYIQENAEKDVPEDHNDENYIPTLKKLRDADWDYCCMGRTPVSHKLKRNNEGILDIIDQVCSQVYCRGELKRVLQDLKYRGILHCSLVRCIGKIYKLDEALAVKKRRILFFLNQFPKIRSYIFASIFDNPEFDKFIKGFKRYKFSCMRRYKVKRINRLFPKERWFFVKDISEGMRYMRRQ